MSVEITYATNGAKDAYERGGPGNASAAMHGHFFTGVEGLLTYCHCDTLTVYTLAVTLSLRTQTQSHCPTVTVFAVTVTLPHCHCEHCHCVHSHSATLLRCTQSHCHCAQSHSVTLYTVTATLYTSREEELTLLMKASAGPKC